MTENIKAVHLADGVDGSTIITEPFKTSRVSVCGYLPLEADRVAEYSMLSLLLSNGCADYPLPRGLNQRLEVLYGASVGFDCIKSGDRLLFVASIVFADDRFLPEPVFDDCVDLLMKMLFEPAVDEGGFLEHNFLREQRMQIEYIEGKINDKRGYALSRCAALMCEGEPFGLTETGTLEQARQMDRRRVYDAWKRLLERANFRISVIAQKEHPEVFERFLTLLKRSGKRDPYPVEPHRVCDAREQVLRVDEAMPIAQGKLAMGFRMEDFGPDSVSYPVMVFTDLFGGGPYSMLFSNVREKQSLCYYCAARAVRCKGVMTVDSGVEFDKMEQTEKAVLEQLERMKKGEFTDEELSASKLALCGSLRSAKDSQAVMDRWYTERWFDSPRLSPEQVEQQIRGVTREDVVRVANGVRLDTVFRLVAKEGAR